MRESVRPRNVRAIFHVIAERHEDCGNASALHIRFITSLNARHNRVEAMKAFHCNRCDQRVFFENVLCERCEALLGYVPELREISAFEDAGEGQWRSLHPDAEGKLYRQCHNYAVENVCNWMLPAD